MIHKAISYAASVHRRQRKKGTQAPYVWHPLHVGWLLQNAGCDEKVIVAGLLHDVVENTLVTGEDLAGEFGPQVAEIVLGVTEDKRLPWEERKKQALASLSRAPLSVRLVAAADKLDNLQAMRRGEAELGPAIWERYPVGRDKQAWFLREMAAAVRVPPEKDHPLFVQLTREVEAFFGAAANPS